MVAYFLVRLPAKACRLVASALLVAALGGQAHAASLVWTERTNGDLTTLAYGPLDPNAIPLFLLSCLQ